MFGLIESKKKRQPLPIIKRCDYRSMVIELAQFLKDFNLHRNIMGFTPTILKACGFAFPYSAHCLEPFYGNTLEIVVSLDLTDTWDNCDKILKLLDIPESIAYKYNEPGSATCDFPINKSRFRKLIDLFKKHIRSLPPQELRAYQQKSVSHIEEDTIHTVKNLAIRLLRGNRDARIPVELFKDLDEHLEYILGLNRPRNALDYSNYIMSLRGTARILTCLNETIWGSIPLLPGASALPGLDALIDKLSIVKTLDRSEDALRISTSFTAKNNTLKKLNIDWHNDYTLTDFLAERAGIHNLKELMYLSIEKLTLIKLTFPSLSVSQLIGLYNYLHAHDSTLSCCHGMLNSSSNTPAFYSNVQFIVSFDVLHTLFPDYLNWLHTMKKHDPERFQNYQNKMDDDSEDHDFRP